MVYVLALLSAAAYGAADFTGGFASRRVPMFSVVTISQLAGLICLLVVLPLLGASSPLRADFVWGAAAGLAGGFGIALLYRALAIGTMGVVAPTTSVCAVGIPVFAGIALGDRPDRLVGAGILLAIIAIVLLGQESTHPDHPASSPSHRGLPAGMWHALASGVAIGVFFLLLARARPEAGLWPLVAARLAGIPCFAAIVVASGASFRMPRPIAWLVIGGGALDMLANVLYLLATRYGSLAVAVTLVSLYPASTVALARVVLHERLSRLQIVGMVAALVAVSLIVLGGAQAPRIVDVAWLQGCWELQAGDRAVEERWMPPRAGSMLGVGRTTRGDELLEHEYIVLSERDGRLAYEAHPSGQASAVFLSCPDAGEEAGEAIVFENPDHDFPQRVGYRRTGPDRLLGWIEGADGGKTRRVEFPYRRVACESPSREAQR